MLRAALAFIVFMLAAPCLFAGAWGYGPFENDDALDWLNDLEGYSGSHFLMTALSTADPNAKYIEAPQCSQALAAAEIVAAARGHASKTLPADAVQWVQRVKLTVTSELLSAARGAVDTCRNSDHSELRILWLQSKQSSRWLAETASLLSRLH
jgi:hypothetical protein